MMSIWNKLGRMFRWICRPVRQNALFFVFMYLLGCVCAWTTLRPVRGAHLYEHLYAELLVDVYVLCLVLMLVPHRIRRWVRLLMAVLFYAIAIVDVYCFVKFDSTLTPTMLLLVGETDSREAAEFLQTYLSADVLTSKVGWVLLVAVAHILACCAARPLCRWILSVLPERRFTPAKAETVLGGMLLLFLLLSAKASYHNKQATWRLMAGRTIGELEHTLTEPDHAVLYTPSHRLAFSLRANALAAGQVRKLVAASSSVRVDSCSFQSPQIVLIIGESLGRHHSAQYGYSMMTTPRQIRREHTGQLVAFSDVVAPWNLTSFVFKYLFSLHVVGEEGEWCDQPLFPELFRAAGYQVTFLTNQFLPKAKEAVYDFSGGFFLNNPALSAAMFDVRNATTHPFDEGLLNDYDQLPSSDRPQLIIFHLLGQHVAYKQRSPKGRKHFQASDYESLRSDLSVRQRRMLADYDNSVLYNDSVVDEICRRFEQEDALVIYMPDHGEECYEEDRGFICRNHTSAVDYPLAHYEFEVPFWIWCSPRYISHHVKTYQQILAAKDRRLMTDALPHMLLGLAGIHTPAYHAEYDVLSPSYDERRPRILKGTADYDRLRDAAQRGTRKNDKETNK